MQDYDADGVLCDEDCDDHDAAVLGPEEEICGDGIDQDCDGEDEVCDTGADGPGDKRRRCECGVHGGRVAWLGWLLTIGVVLGRRRR